MFLFAACHLHIFFVLSLCKSLVITGFISSGGSFGGSLGAAISAGGELAFPVFSWLQIIATPNPPIYSLIDLKAVAQQRVSCLCVFWMS